CYTFSNSGVVGSIFAREGVVPRVVLQDGIRLHYRCDDRPCPVAFRTVDREGGGSPLPGMQPDAVERKVASFNSTFLQELIVVAHDVADNNIPSNAP
ncbi:hypothetical protein CRG98_007050, partial [Punica granatum]